MVIACDQEHISVMLSKKREGERETQARLGRKTLLFSLFKRKQHVFKWLKQTEKHGWKSKQEEICQLDFFEDGSKESLSAPHVENLFSSPCACACVDAICAQCADI